MCKRPETTFVANSVNTANLAIAKMGPRLVGSTPTSTRQLEVCCSGGGIFFSMWVEAKPLATITLVRVQKFFWQNIVCRFGVPKAITVDNGTQFNAETFKDFCDRIGTKIHFASVRHPELNGLVERANGIIMTGIMKLIFNQPRGKWPDKLIKVVWNHNTTASRSTRFTPFKLLFGDESITPEESKTGSIRTIASAEDEADYQVIKDTIEGTRLQAIEHINKYQAETIKWRDRKVRLKTLSQGIWCFGE
jgi:transposase InsO family protein